MKILLAILLLISCYLLNAQDVKIGVVQAHDPDLTYKITMGNEKGYFSINNEGLLTMKKEEYDKITRTTQFILIVEVSESFNPQSVSKATITVNIRKKTLIQRLTDVIKPSTEKEINP